MTERHTASRSVPEGVRRVTQESFVYPIPNSGPLPRVNLPALGRLVASGKSPNTCPSVSVPVLPEARPHLVTGYYYRKMSPTCTSRLPSQPQVTF